MEMYDTALLVGRAFSLANGKRNPVEDPVTELHSLAADDPIALELARERFRSFLVSRPSLEDQLAFDLLCRAIDASTPVAVASEEPESRAFCAG